MQVGGRSHAFAYLLARGLPALIGLVTIAILTRLLSPANYGRYSLLLGAVTLCVSVVGNGAGHFALRYYTEYCQRGTARTFTLSVALATAAAALSIGCVVIIASALFLYALDIMVLISALLLMINLSIFTVLAELLRAVFRIGTFLVVQVTFSIFGLIFGLLGYVWLISDVYMLLLGLANSALLATLLVLFALREDWSSNNLRDLSSKELLLQIGRFAWPIAFGGLSLWLLRLVDRYILASFLPEATVGFYVSAYDLAERAVSLIILPLALSFQPRLFAHWNNEETLTKTIQTYLQFFTFSIPIVFAFTLFSSIFLRILIGFYSEEIFSLFIIVTFGNLLFYLSQFFLSLLIAARKTKIIGFTQLVATLTNVGLNLVLIPRIGAYGAALSTVVSFFVLFVLQAWWTWPYLRPLFVRSATKAP